MSEPTTEEEQLAVKFALSTDMTVATVQVGQITIIVMHPRDETTLAGAIVEQLPEIIVAAIEQADQEANGEILAGEDPATADPFGQQPGDRL